MKTIAYSVLLVLFFLPLSMKAQDVISKQLEGTWLLNYKTTMAKMESQAKVKYNSFSAEKKVEIERVYKGRIIQFNRNGSFLQTLADGRKVSGRWIYNIRTKNLEITSPQGKVYFQKVKGFTGSY